MHLIMTDWNKFVVSRSIMRTHLSLSFPPQEREYCARPRLDIIQPLSETCEEISSDALTVRGFQENECRDYHLGERPRLWLMLFLILVGLFSFT